LNATDSEQTDTLEVEGAQWRALYFEVRPGDGHPTAV